MQPAQLEQPLLGDGPTPRAAARPSLLLQLFTSAFLTVLADIYAASFGLLLILRSGAVPPALGIPIYLASGLAAQIATIFGSGVSFATGGTSIEVMPLLMPIAALADDTALSEAQQASTLLAMYGLTSALIGLLYVGVSRLRFGGIFRCIPLIVLKSALTGVGVFMLVETQSMSSGCDVGVSSEGLATLLQPAVWPKAAIGCGLGLVLFIVDVRDPY